MTKDLPMLLVQPAVVAPAVELGVEQELEVEAAINFRDCSNRNADSTHMRP